MVGCLKILALFQWGPFNKTVSYLDKTVLWTIKKPFGLKTDFQRSFCGN